MGVFLCLVMGRIILVMALLLSFGLLHAQKVVKKAVLNPETSYVLINAANCFKISISTTSSKEIRVEALIDGEYKNDLLVKIEEDGPSIGISAGFHPNFKKPNDKLSAHKVISISLKLHIPENMKVRLIGTSTNVYAEGDYEDLKVSLDDGSCSIDSINGTVQATTRSGDIHVRSKGANIVTNNSFGSISENNIPKGANHYNLITTTGNIYLKKIE